MLDYTIKDYATRKKLVEKIISNTPNLPPSYLDKLGDYLLDALPKEPKSIITPNRQVTISKRESSFQDLSDKFEGGEDSLYALFADSPSSCLLQPKISITEADIQEIPPLKPLRDAISSLESDLSKASGRKRFQLKKQIIEMRKDQYAIKEIFKPAVKARVPAHLQMHQIEAPYDEAEKCSLTYLADPLPPPPHAISLYNPSHISALLCNYDLLLRSKAAINTNLHYMAENFFSVAGRALEEPEASTYKAIVEAKIAGKTNEEIRAELNNLYTCEHISTVWRKKIPKYIAEKAKEYYIEWRWKTGGGAMKRCNRCGELKPAHKYFFSINKSSKDHLYSICKKCRKMSKKGV